MSKLNESNENVINSTSLSATSLSNTNKIEYKNTSSFLTTTSTISQHSHKSQIQSIGKNDREGGETTGTDDDDDEIEKLEKSFNDDQSIIPMKRTKMSKFMNYIKMVFDVIIYQILKFQDEPLENTFQKIIFTISSGFMSVVMLLGLIFTGNKNMQIAFIILLVFFVLNTIIYFMMKNYEKLRRVFLFVFSIVFNVVFILLIAFSASPGILFNPMYEMFLLVPVINILLSGNPLIWIIVFVVLLFVALVIDMIFGGFDIPESFLNDKKTGMIMQRFVVFLMTTGFVLITSLYYKYMVSGERKMVEKISHSIADLQLDTPYVKEFLNRKSYSKIVDYLKRVIINMRGYKTFLPDSLMQSEESKELSHELSMMSIISDCSEKTDISKLSPRKSKISNSSTKSSRSSGRSSGGRRRRRKQNSNVSSGILSKGLNVRKEVYILEKSVTTLQVKVFFGKDLLACSKEEVQGIFHSLMDIVVPNTKLKGGNIFNIFNDSCYICFNATSVSVQSVKKAAELVFVIQEKWKKRTDYGPVKLHFAIKRFDSFAGNFGNDSIRRFNIFGDGFEEMQYICSLNNKYGSSFVVDRDVYEELKYNFKCKQVDYIVDKMLDIFEVLAPKAKKKDNEWMYELGDELTSGGEEVEYENAWNYYKKDKLDEAVKSLEKSPHRDKYVENLMKLITRKKMIIS